MRSSVDERGLCCAILSASPEASRSKSVGAQSIHRKEIRDEQEEARGWNWWAAKVTAVSAQHVVCHQSGLARASPEAYTGEALRHARPTTAVRRMR